MFNGGIHNSRLQNRLLFVLSFLTVYIEEEKTTVVIHSPRKYKFDWINSYYKDNDHLKVINVLTKNPVLCSFRICLITDYHVQYEIE